MTITFNKAQTLNGKQVSILNIKWKKGFTPACRYALVKSKRGYFIAEYRSHGWKSDGKGGWSITDEPEVSPIGMSSPSARIVLDAFIERNKSNLA